MASPRELFGSDRMWGLKELPPPEPVSWLPAAPGWWLVAAILLATMGWLAWRLWRVWQRERYRRDALARIAAMDGALGELPLVLRVTALAAFPREEVAGLRGEAWVAWLNANGGRFEPSDASCLDRLPYDPRAASQLTPDATDRLVAASRAWVKGHRARL